MDSALEKWQQAMQLGVRTLKGGDLTAAAVAFAAATSHLPDRPEAWVNLAVVKLNLADPEGATAAINTALRAHPDYAPALSCMGDIQRTLGALEQAAGWYQKALAISPDPMVINNLATLTRTLGNHEEAEKLYREAEHLAPAFTLPKVNRAVMHIEQRRIDEAAEQLTKLIDMPLPQNEKAQAESALHCIGEYQRLTPVIEDVLNGSSFESFARTIADLPSSHLSVDDAAMELVSAWASDVSSSSYGVSELDLLDLPHDWPEVEAAHMIPIIETAAELRFLLQNSQIEKQSTLEQAQTNRMIAAIRAAADIRRPFSSSERAEAYLRFIHCTCTRDLEIKGFFPGHFRYTPGADRLARHVQIPLPRFVAGTFRAAVTDYFNKMSPSLERAAFMRMVLSLLHPFSDGSGRVNLTVLNRNLIEANLMPCLFPRHLGIAGALGEASVDAVKTGSLARVVQVLVEGQRHAIRFLDDLKSHDSHHD